MPYWGVAIYTIAPRADQTGFDVAIIDYIGTRQTMLGFKTKSEAEAWIEKDKKREKRP